MIFNPQIIDEQEELIWVEVGVEDEDAEFLGQGISAPQMVVLRVPDNSSMVSAKLSLHLCLLAWK